MSGAHRRAFIDESQSHRELDRDTYLLAASICEPAHENDVRETMRQLRLKGQTKLHWRDESEPRRRQIAEAIASLPIDQLVVVRDGLPRERSERRRRLCLQRMLFELETSGVGDATFESRGPADDKRDRILVDTLRAQRAVGAGVRIDHVKGPLDALLWVPDAICGAVSAMRTGNDVFLKIIEQRTEVRIVTLGP